MRKQKKFKRSRADKILMLISISMPLAAVIGFLFAYFQMERLELGILDVCATQQDAYVSLVLDQINLNSDRDNEEIIRDILGTLDASSNKYWTFSTEQAMLFVKDVLETNKYKGVTVETYFVEDSASDFFHQLPLNRVAHANIIISNQEYIASGTSFEYKGYIYKLCLLTNRAVLLDNNSFLGAKTELWMMFFCILGMLVVIPMLLALEIRKMQAKQREEEKVIQSMNENLIKMNERLSYRDLHDTRNNLWQEKALDKFIEGLKAKGVIKAVFMRIHCPASDARQQFLAMSRYSLDSKVLRFEAGESDLILLFVEGDYDNAFFSVIPLLTRDITIQKTVIAGGDGGLSIENAVREIQSAAAISAANTGS